MNSLTANNRLSQQLWSVSLNTCCYGMNADTKSPAVSNHRELYLTVGAVVAGT